MGVDGIRVILERLLESAQIDPSEVWVWNQADEPATIAEIKSRYLDGELGDDRPFGDMWKHPVKEQRSREYHINRIIYFMRNPEEIARVEVDNECSYGKYNSFILPQCAIVDGWHRIAAAIALNLTYLDIEYGGREDIQMWLTGEIDNAPSEVISLGCGCP